MTEQNLNTVLRKLRDEKAYLVKQIWKGLIEVVRYGGSFTKKKKKKKKDEFLKVEVGREK